jgi:lysophospholipase L1-like esterase
VRLIKILAVQILLGLMLVEIGLRIYNPFPFRVRGGRIVLPVHRRYTFHNNGAAKLEPVTHHTKNSLGFRGPDPPSDFARRLTLITIGGSTTECLFLSDGKTWTDVLARALARDRADVWVNNAGLDGHSTYGHLVLLRDFIVRIRPKVAVFLIGVNDVGLAGVNDYDASLAPSWVPWRERWNPYEAALGIHRTPWRAEWVFLTTHVELAGVIENFRRVARAREAGFTHQEINLTALATLAPDAAYAEATLARLAEPLRAYEGRVAAIVELCRASGIEPVLITQPALFGDAVDPVTGVNLATVQVRTGMNGSLSWRVQEHYNDVTRRVAREQQVLLVDAAGEMPKDSRLFYDFIHLTNDGAARLGDLVAARVGPFVKAR